MNKRAILLLGPILCTSACGGYTVCQAHSVADIEESIASGACDDIYVAGVTDEVISFTNDSRSEVFINDIDNPAVRRVEVAGLGGVNVNGIEEVVLTNASCRAGGFPNGARLVDIAIGGPQWDVDVTGCSIYPEANSTVRVRAEEGVAVDFLNVSAVDGWNTVTLEIDKSAQPKDKLLSGGTVPLDILQQCGSAMETIQLTNMDAAVLDSYLDWLDSEGYAGVVVLTDVETGEKQQVYPRVEG